MEIRDVIHGSISVQRGELPILDSRYFQRLRQIKQLGFTENSFPNATHTRYIHSLGAMETATQAFDTIFDGPRSRSSERAPGDGIALFTAHKGAHERFRQVLRLAALLHDVGHGPLSHTTEFAMPDLRELKVPLKRPVKARQATHEDYTLKIILDSGLTPFLEKLGKVHGFTPLHIAALIEPTIEVEDDFFQEKVAGETIDFRPILQQLISSELDADRMDYLRRDSWHAGVSYGQFDYDWLVSNLTSEVRKGTCYLALQHRALYALEDFLISRFHMFLMVYFHYKSVVYDEMLARYLGSPDRAYQLPADIEKYCDSNDADLYSHLAQSSNPWAKRISNRESYRMLIELHSGIPATQTAAQEQERLLMKVKKQLQDVDIDFLEATSTSELSKYFRKPAAPIFVRYDNHYSAPSSIPLHKCTDLFTRYAEKRSIRRLYVSPEDYRLLRLKGRGAPRKYEEETGGPQGSLFQ